MDNSEQSTMGHRVERSIVCETDNTDLHNYLSAIHDCLQCDDIDISNLEDVVTNFVSFVCQNIDNTFKVLEYINDFLTPAFDIRSLYILQIPFSPVGVDACVKLLYLFSTCEIQYTQPFFVESFIPTLISLALIPYPEFSTRVFVYLTLKNLIIDHVIDDPYILPLYDVVFQNIQAFPEDRSFIELLSTIMFYKVNPNDSDWINNIMNIAFPILLSVCTDTSQFDIEEVSFALDSLHILVKFGIETNNEELVHFLQDSILQIFNIHRNHASVAIHLFQLLCLFDATPTYLFQIRVDPNLIQQNEQYAINFAKFVGTFLDRGVEYVDIAFDASWISYLVEIMCFSSFKARKTAVTVFIDNFGQMPQYQVKPLLKAGLITGLSSYVTIDTLPVLSALIAILMGGTPADRYSGFLKITSCDIMSQIDEIREDINPDEDCMPIHRFDELWSVFTQVIQHENPDEIIQM